MITLVTGSGGSGKSYYCVREILDTIQQGRKVYTNIKMYLEHSNYNYLNEGNMKNLISEISSRFENVDDFPKLIDELKKKEWFGSRLFLDEVHLMGFREKSEGLINFLSVQRHLNLDVFLITQTLKKINIVYHPDVHHHVACVPANQRPNKNLIGWKTYEEVGGDKIATKYVQPDTPTFDLYKTGKNDSASNPFAKKMVFMIILFAVVVTASIYLFNSATSMGAASNSTEPTKIMSSATEDNKDDQDENNTVIESYGIVCYYTNVKPIIYVTLEKLEVGYTVCRKKTL